MGGVTFHIARNDLSLPRQAQSNYTLSRCFLQLMIRCVGFLLCSVLFALDEGNILRFLQFANKHLIFVTWLTIYRI